MLLSGQMVIIFLIINFANVYCTYKDAHNHKNFRKWSINLMGYEKDENGKYPVVIGKKYGSIYLACEVEFIEPTKIRWLRNKNGISLPPPYSLPWKKGRVLMVRPLIYGRTDGVYECIASNGYVSLRKGVNITIREINELPKGFPQIITHPGHVRTLRNNVDFHCIVSGKAPIKILWFHNRVPLSSSSAYNVSPTTHIGHTFSSNLMIKNVTKQTKGFYQCIAMNSIGHAVSKQGNMQFRGENKHRRYPRNIIKADECLPKINTGVFIGVPLNVTVTCKFIHTREVYQEIIWKPPISGADLIKSYILTFRSANTTHCLQLKGHHRFDFDKESGFDTSKIYTVTVSAISGANNDIVSEGVVKTNKCPEDIVVGTLSNQKIDAGESFTFNCMFKGRPNPELYQIKWRFSKDYNRCEGQRTLYKSSNVIISNDKRKVEIIDATSDQQGCYVCSVTNDMSDDETKGFLLVRAEKKKMKNVLAPSLGGICGGLLLVGAIILVFKCFIKQKHIIPPDIENPRCVVYISHCAKEERSKEKLLRFANLLQKEYGVKVIMDLTSIIAINNAGGMCRWLPQAMHRANKIMVVLSKDYLKTLKLQDKSDEIVCKVHAEFSTVKNIIYHDCQRTRRLVIISDGVNPRDFPDSFNGRSFFVFPQCIDKDDTDVYRIVGVLLDEEIIQLPTQQLLHSGCAEDQSK